MSDESILETPRSNDCQPFSAAPAPHSLPIGGVLIRHFVIPGFAFAGNPYIHYRFSCCQPDRIAKRDQGAVEAANPAIGINYNFGASGSLEKQIEQGAPADLFLAHPPKI